MSRQLLRQLGFDVIRYPSRALHEAVGQSRRLQKQVEDLRRENEALREQILSYDYDEDGLRLWAKSLDFLKDPRFTKAYEQGMNSGHKIQRSKGSTEDIGIRYRVYTCCWAASYSKNLIGDFVECGVNTGIVSLAVCDYVDFNSLNKKFFLFDTFRGIPIEQASTAELQHVKYLNREYYEECYETAKQNFAPYPDALLVRGLVPDSLEIVTIEKVAYLHLDMNLAYPEIAALTHFWDRLVPGAVVVLDDYGWSLNRPQKDAMDDFARQKGVDIYTAPTGQGILILS